MANESLARLSEQQLTKLFSSLGNLPLSERAKQIISEMEQRGLIYDPRGADFIPCEEWNERHGHVAAMDCEKQARRLGRTDEPD